MFRLHAARSLYIQWSAMGFVGGHNNCNNKRESLETEVLLIMQFQGDCTWGFVGQESETHTRRRNYCRPGLFGSFRSGIVLFSEFESSCSDSMNKQAEQGDKWMTAKFQSKKGLCQMHKARVWSLQAKQCRKKPFFLGANITETNASMTQFIIEQAYIYRQIIHQLSRSCILLKWNFILK